MRFMLLLFLSVCHLHSAPNDTISERIAAPGAILRQYHLIGPNVVNVLEIDLKNPHLRLESFRPAKLLPITGHAVQNSRPDHKVIAAINADFFSFESGWPVNSQVAQGEPIAAKNFGRSEIAIDPLNRIAISPFSFSGVAMIGDSLLYDIKGVNSGCPKDGAVLFTSRRDSLTLRDSANAFLRLRRISPAWSMDDTMQFEIVEACSFSVWELRDDECLLAARNAASLVERANKGDLMKLFLHFSPIPFHPTELLSGWGRLLREGANIAAQADTNEGLSAKFTAVLHPRTFVGLNAESTRLFLCTVDGRQSSSIGMTFRDMAAFLLQIGATDGFNLDGGGSTEMVVNGEIINSPSDKAGERPVANSLQVIWRE